MNIEGKIIYISGLIKINNFEKREVVIETQEKYPQKIMIEFSNKTITALDKYRSDDFVKVEFNLRGREWNGKYFNTLSGWKIEPVI